MVELSADLRQYSATLQPVVERRKRQTPADLVEQVHTPCAVIYCSTVIIVLLGTSTIGRTTVARNKF